MPLNFGYEPFQNVGSPNPWQNALSSISALQKLRSANIANKLGAAKAQYAGPTMQQQLQQMQLANQKQQELMKYVDPMAQQQLALAKQKAQNPLLNASGAAGQIGAMMYLQDLAKQHQTGSSLGSPTQVSSSPFAQNAQAIQNALTGRLAAQEAQTKYKNIESSALPWRNLPPDEKEANLAKARGMGYTSDEASNLFSNGKTLSDLASAKGFQGKDLEEIPSIYAPKGGAISQVQMRKIALNELDNMSPTIAQWTAPYARRFDGFSPTQIADAISNDDPEKQAKFLAGRIVGPEFQALRVKAMSGRVGEGAIKDLTDKALQNFNIYQGLVSPEVYKRAQTLATQLIENSANKANSAFLNMSQPKKSTTTSVPSASKNDPLGIR